MKLVIISLFVSFAVLLTSCSKAVTTSSSKPESIAAPAPAPEHTRVSTPKNETPPPDFVEFEKAPKVIKKAKPRYPEIARKAGLEGRV